MRRGPYSRSRSDREYVAIRLYLSHVTACTKRGLQPMSRPDWEEIALKPCAYCGGMDERVHFFVSAAQKFKRLNINGVDRIDNTRGYVQGNCAPCCKVCNRMKTDNTLQEFLAHVEKVYKHAYLQVSQQGLTKGVV